MEDADSQDRVVMVWWVLLLISTKAWTIQLFLCLLSYSVHSCWKGWCGTFSIGSENWKALTDNCPSGATWQAFHQTLEAISSNLSSCKSVCDPCFNHKKTGAREDPRLGSSLFSLWYKRSVFIVSRSALFIIWRRVSLWMAEMLSCVNQLQEQDFQRVKLKLGWNSQLFRVYSCIQILILHFSFTATLRTQKNLHRPYDIYHFLHFFFKARRQTEVRDSPEDSPSLFFQYISNKIKMEQLLNSNFTKIIWISFQWIMLNNISLSLFCI